MSEGTLRRSLVVIYGLRRRAQSKLKDLAYFESRIKGLSATYNQFVSYSSPIRKTSTNGITRATSCVKTAAIA